MALELINKLNLAQLKIFESVYRNKSMTLAAKELFLTQSGVSQHVKSLESQLGLGLFVRNRNGLYTTEAADKIYKSYVKAFSEIDSTLKSLHSVQPKELTGTLKIGLPTEFGNNILIPYLSEWSKKNKQVKFDFIYGYGLSLIQQLEDGSLDMAFIDSIQSHKKIASKVVFQETLNLVATNQYLKSHVRSSKESLKDILSLDFLEYEHKENILRLWISYHYGKKNVNLNVKAWAMNVQGVASLVKQSMGAAILPDHLIEKLIKQGQHLHIFKGKKTSLKNDISVAWLKDKPKTQAAEELIKYIIKN